MRRLLAGLLILTGLCLVAYPMVRERYFDYRQQGLMTAWAESREVAVLPEAGEEEDQAEPAPVGDPDSSREKYIQENMEGVLAIQKIGLKMPVLKKDTKKNLNISIAHVAGTAGPGEVGNYVIAGHRMRSYGRHFNRLHELREGDDIQFIGPHHTYLYRVFEVLVIEPEETWVLEPEEGERLITLVTCDYSRKPWLRLVVRGRLVPWDSVSSSSGRRAAPFLIATSTAGQYYVDVGRWRFHKYLYM